jgi:hypothetical protein
MSLTAGKQLLLTSASGAYQISRSLRFNSGDSSYLGRTPASAGNRQTWSLSCWVKRSVLGVGYQNILSAANSSSDRYEFYFTPSDELSGEIRIGGTGYTITTTPIYRDPGAWYHLLVVMDTTQATAADRHKIYINGTQVTNFSSASYPPQNATPQFNAADPHSIGRSQLSGQYFSGYLADIHFIDGQALTPTSFTTTDLNGELQPKTYGGSYGTNGFKLSFSDNSTTAALGTDTSGNGNTWTVNNFSVTAGANNDSLTDTPTSYGTDTGAGGEVRGNYCCVNFNDKNNGASVDLKDGNLEYVVSSSSQHGCRRSTFALSSGKWYAECTVKVATSGTDRIGILSASQADYVTNSNPHVGFFSQGYAYMSSGQKENNNVSVSYGASYTTGDIIGIAMDMDAGTVTFYKNGSSQGQAYSGLSGAFCFAGSPYNGGTHVWNFGQRAWAYTPPANHRPIVDTLLPTPVVAKGSSAMDVVLYTGNTPSSQTITQLNFSPDLVWLKVRNAGDYHQLYDAVRGATNYLHPNVTNAEASDANGLTAFTSNGFSVGSTGGVNSGSMVAWAWDAGTSTVTNTAGSITSQVRANASAGFSVVTYTVGNNTSQTIGHGLGVAPQLLLVKERNQANNWQVYHASLGNGNFLYLNGTNASAANNLWNNTSPTSTVFSIRSGGSSNFYDGKDQVCYAFAPVSGYSSFGSYTGNGSADGPFVYTEMRPRWILTKRSDGGANGWGMYDALRPGYNLTNSFLQAQDAGAEVTGASAYSIDILSNGFKVRGTDAFVNQSAGTYIFAAFAQSPFAYSRAR